MKWVCSDYKNKACHNFIACFKARYNLIKLLERWEVWFYHEVVIRIFSSSKPLSKPVIKTVSSRLLFHLTKNFDLIAMKAEIKCDWALSIDLL